MTPTEVSKLTTYLRKVYGSRTLAVRPRPKNAMVADFCVGEEAIGTVTVDDEDGDRSYQLAYEIKEKPQSLSVTELLRLQAFLREKLGSKALVVRGRVKLKDSAEVFVGDESYALITADKTSYQFQMAILDIDLEDLDA
jgi:Protein of unknown function (DUF3126)